MKFFEQLESKIILFFLILLGILSTQNLPGIINTHVVIGFYVLLVLLLFVNKEKFDVQGKIIYLYRTNVGLKLMDGLAKRAGKLIRITGVFGIFVAYLGLFFFLFVFLKQAYEVLFTPISTVLATPIIPGVKLSSLDITFPLVIGWISLFVIICVHEFAHGVVARAFKIPVKSSGFVFFGPIPGAFVEPDEKNLVKQKKFKQLAVFAAGPFSNILLTIVVVLFSIFLVSPAFTNINYPVGINIYPIENPDLPLNKAGITSKTLLQGIDGVETKTWDQLDKKLDEIKPNQKITLTLDGKDVDVVTTSHPDNATKAYIGFNMKGSKFSSFLPIGFSEFSSKEGILNKIAYSILLLIDELFWWIAFISFNVGLFNLLPLFITDGARMLRLNIGEKRLMIWKILNYIVLFALFTIIFLPLFRQMIPGMV